MPVFGIFIVMILSSQYDLPDSLRRSPVQLLMFLEIASPPRLSFLLQRAPHKYLNLPIVESVRWPNEDHAGEISGRSIAAGFNFCAGTDQVEQVHSCWADGKSNESLGSQAVPR